MLLPHIPITSAPQELTVRVLKGMKCKRLTFKCHFEKWSRPPSLSKFADTLLLVLAEDTCCHAHQVRNVSRCAILQACCNVSCSVLWVLFAQAAQPPSVSVASTHQNRALWRAIVQAEARRRQGDKPTAHCGQQCATPIPADTVRCAYS